MAITNVLASVAVKDLALALEWYQRLLGRPADSRPMPGLAEWKFERGGWLQVYQLAERAGSGSFTLSISDMDEQIAHLNRVGISAGKANTGDKVTTLMLSDPDGNHVAFAQARDPGIAQ